MYGNELPASHSAHFLCFTARSAATWGQFGISSHCLNQQNQDRTVNRTAQSRSNSSRIPRRCVFMVKMHIFIIVWHLCS